MNNIVKMAESEELHQALFTKNCSTQERAKKLIGKGGSNYTNVHYAFLAKYGGEPFSAKQAQAALEATSMNIFNPGTTIEEILNDSVRFGILHKLE